MMKPLDKKKNDLFKSITTRWTRCLANIYSNVGTRGLVSKDIMVTGQHKNLVSNESLKMSSHQNAKVTMLAFRALALRQRK